MTEDFTKEEIIQAAARVLTRAAFRVLQSDPHNWSIRPCSTCKAVSAVLGEPFGCDLLRKQRAVPTADKQ